MKNKWLRRIDDVFLPARVTQSSQNEECDLCRAVPCRGNFSIGILLRRPVNVDASN